MPTLQEQMQQAYPWTAGLPYNLIDSTAKGDPTRQLEYYPADETDNPQPGKPTIEIFNPKITAQDLMGELLSHYLPGADPAVAGFRQQILSSLTPAQRQELRGDYLEDQKAGLLDKGETLDDWLTRQGGDAFFRGQPTGQWPASIYTPQQQDIYRQLNEHLNKTYQGPRSDAAAPEVQQAGEAPAPTDPLEGVQLAGDLLGFGGKWGDQSNRQLSPNRPWPSPLPYDFYSGQGLLPDRNFPRKIPRPANEAALKEEDPQVELPPVEIDGEPVPAWVRGMLATAGGAPPLAQILNTMAEPEPQQGGLLSSLLNDGITLDQIVGPGAMDPDLLSTITRMSPPLSKARGTFQDLMGPPGYEEGEVIPNMSPALADLWDQEIKAGREAGEREMPMVQGVRPQAQQQYDVPRTLSLIDEGDTPFITNPQYPVIPGHRSLSQAITDLPIEPIAPPQAQPHPAPQALDIDLQLQQLMPNILQAIPGLLFGYKAGPLLAAPGTGDFNLLAPHKTEPGVPGVPGGNAVGPMEFRNPLALIPRTAKERQDIPGQDL